MIQIDKEFRIKKAAGNFTLERLEDVVKKDNSISKEWKFCGHHGSMHSAMKGYVRHSIDTCENVVDMLEKIERIEKGLKK